MLILEHTSKVMAKALTKSKEVALGWRNWNAGGKIRFHDVNFTWSDGHFSYEVEKCSIILFI